MEMAFLWDYGEFGGNFSNASADDQYVVAILLLEGYFFENVGFLVFNKNQEKSKCSWEIQDQLLDHTY